VSVPTAGEAPRSLAVVEPGETTAGAPGDAVAVGWNAADAVYFDEISVTDSTTVEDLEVL